MLGLMEKQLELKNIPWEYELCFNENCPLREKCLHYQAYLLQPARRLGGPAIYPSAWKSGECSRFTEAKLIQKAWGFDHLYDNVPNNLKSAARQDVHAYLGSGQSAYYRVHHGERMLSPRQQRDILHILSRYCSTEGISFDHYVTDFDFS